MSLNPFVRMLTRLFVAAACALALNAHAGLALNSERVLVVDRETNKILYAKSADEPAPIASVTKLMTAMVLLDEKPNMKEVITITAADVDTLKGSSSRLPVGTRLSREDMLHLTLMSSENRAAHALARTAPQGLNAFVIAMNRKAKQLGMNNTHFVDPTGLSEKNQSTASDLSRLVLAASGYPEVREYSTTEQHVQRVGDRLLQYRNSDPLVKEGSWDISVQKTGYIIEAGHSVVLRTKLADRDVVMVILDADGNRTRTADAQRLRRHFDPEADARAVADARAAANRRKQEQALAARKRKQEQVAAAKASERKSTAKKAPAKPVAKAKASTPTRTADARKSKDS